jgi:hypothetical protein
LSVHRKDQADHHHGPGHGGLARRGAQRTEAEHHEQVAEKQHADFRREISEREQEHSVDGGLGCDKIVIAEALVETQFREQHVERNESQSAESVGWGQRNGHRPGIGVGQQYEAVEQKAAGNHRLELAALSGPACQPLSSQPRLPAFQFARDRAHE